jgi:cell wall-associated NlpC family hydrolase
MNATARRLAREAKRGHEQKSPNPQYGVVSGAPEFLVTRKGQMNAQEAYDYLVSKNVPPLVAWRALRRYYPKLPRPKAEPASGGRQNTSYAADPRVNTVVSFAHQQIGKPYVFGSGPDYASFDCSDLVQAAYKQIGVNIPRTTFDQWKVGRPVKWGQFQPGDLIFTAWDSKRKAPGHVMLYIGNGKMISAPYTGSTVKIVDVSSYKNSFVTARRILGGGSA